MAFNPKSEYTIIPSEIHIKDFFEYKDDFVTRPPYQRKAVWSRIKKQSLMDSLFRRYYIPKLVIREVRLDENRTVNEIIDGQQRITTVQDFFNNKFPLPKTLENISKDLPGSYYKELQTDYRKFVDKSLKYQTDIIKDIEDPNNVEHQITATEIFWRLQQGETLNYMEIAHAQLSSLVRNFIVKYSDDETFDFIKYQPLDNNLHKHKFFKLLNVTNERMKHLQYMARFLLIEKGGGYFNLQDKEIEKLINSFKDNNGIGNDSFEKNKIAKSVLKNLDYFYSIFKNDEMLDSNNGIKEFSTEYFIISIYVLIRHLGNNYAKTDNMKTAIKEFVYNFYSRWKNYDESSDHDMLLFCSKRQQGESELQIRDRIIRQLFFEFIKSKKYSIQKLDKKRAFNEQEKIKIYRDSNGRCKECLKEGKSEEESKVSWSDYQADHILPYSLGGKTELTNAQLLCKTHNNRKSNKLNL